MFPPTLREVDAAGDPAGNAPGDLSGFGRLDGMLPHPQGQHVNANIFVPGGGYVGVIDVSTKEAVALIRVTASNVAGGPTRSVPRSFWSADGSAIFFANLSGKLVERIDVTRNVSGKITDLALNRSAMLGVGKGMAVVTGATVFRGKSAHGRPMLGRITGEYATADLDDLTPGGLCRESDRGSGPDGGRPNDVINCPIPPSRDLVYITNGGGGLLVANLAATPMRIAGEYDNVTVKGAGCGGAQAGDYMSLNAGDSASGAGASWSTFTVYRLDDAALAAAPLPVIAPLPDPVFADPANTATGGSTTGDAANGTGRHPGVTSRRDAHGTAIKVDRRYVHIVDRIRNVVEVFDTATLARTSYDLTSADGAGGGTGPCAAASVADDPGSPLNDPAPDLIEMRPDGKCMVVAIRGPVPVSVTRSAQGSCPGVGIVELTEVGAPGGLAGVLRSTNLVDTAPAGLPGWHAYSGAEHSDIHGAAVVALP